MGLIDTHCHLDMLKGTPDEALAEARAAGVDAVVTIGIDLRSSRIAAGLAARSRRRLRHGRGAPARRRELRQGRAHRPRAAARPAAASWPSASAAWTSTATSPRATSSGRCSSSSSTWRAPPASRSACTAARPAARPSPCSPSTAPGCGSILHCFSTPEYVELCNERGYFVSFAGNLTYKSSDDLRTAAAAVRDDLLLVETDAPFLTPHAATADRANRPAHVALTAQFLARLRGWSDDEVAAVTSANACRAFAHRRSARRSNLVSAAPRTPSGQTALRPASPRRPGHARAPSSPWPGCSPDDVVLEVGAARRPADGAPRRAGALRARLRDRPALRRQASTAWRPAATTCASTWSTACATGSPTSTRRRRAVVANLAYNIAVPLLMRTIAGLPERAALGGDAPARARRAALRQAAHQGLLGRVGAGAALLRARGAAGRAAHGLRAAAAGRFGLRRPSRAAAWCRPTRPPCSIRWCAPRSASGASRS